MSKVVQESAVRIMAADSCKEIQDLLDDGCDLAEALWAIEERWPRRWNPITLATVSAMRGRFVVDHVVGVCDFVELNVKHMLGVFDADSEEMAKREPELAAAFEARRATKLLVTDRELDRLLRLHPGRWRAQTIADTRDGLKEGYLDVNDIEGELDATAQGVAMLDAEDAWVAAGKGPGFLSAWLGPKQLADENPGRWPARSIEAARQLALTQSLDMANLESELDRIAATQDDAERKLAGGMR